MSIVNKIIWLLREVKLKNLSGDFSQIMFLNIAYFYIYPEKKYILYVQEVQEVFVYKEFLKNDGQVLWDIQYVYIIFIGVGSVHNSIILYL